LCKIEAPSLLVTFGASVGTPPSDSDSGVSISIN